MVVGAVVRGARDNDATRLHGPQAEVADEPERLPIGITRPLSGTDAMSIMFPGTVLALFALGVWAAR